MPTLVLCMSTRARRSLLERLPRKSLTNLLAYLRLSPQPPHCHALRFSRSGASSHVQRSMRPALHALAKAWVKPAEEMAYRKAVSLKPGKYYRVQHKYHFQKEAFFSDNYTSSRLQVNSSGRFYSLTVNKDSTPLILQDFFLHTSATNDMEWQRNIYIGNSV